MLELDARFKTLELRKNALLASAIRDNKKTSETKHQNDESHFNEGYYAIDEYIEKEIDDELYLMVSYFSCEKNAYEMSFGEWCDSPDSNEKIKKIGIRKYYIEKVSSVFECFHGIFELSYFNADPREVIYFHDFLFDKPSYIVYSLFEGREAEIVGKYKREIQTLGIADFDNIKKISNGDCLIVGRKEDISKFFHNCNGVRGEYYCAEDGEYSAIALHEIDYKIFSDYVKEYPELELTFEENYDVSISAANSNKICSTSLRYSEREENAPACDFDKFDESYQYPWVDSTGNLEGTVIELVEDRSTLFDCSKFTYDGQKLKLKQTEKLFKKITIEDIARVCTVDNSTKNREKFLIKFLKEHSLENIKKVIVHYQGYKVDDLENLLDDKTASLFNFTHIHFYEKTTFDFVTNTAEKKITKRLFYLDGLETKEKILDSFEILPIKGTGLAINNNAKNDSTVSSVTNLGYEISRGVLKNVSVIADSFTIPEDVRKIDKFAFISSKIKKIIIGPNVKTIDKKAFVKCSTLKTIEFGKGVSIEGLKFTPFAEAKIKKIILSNGTEVSVLSDIYYNCFYDGADGVDFDFVKLAGNIEFAHGNKEEQKIIDDLLEMHANRVGSNLKVLLNAKISFIVGEKFYQYNKKYEIKRIVDQFNISKELNYPYLILQSNFMDDLELATFFLEMSGTVKKAHMVEIPCTNNNAKLNIKVRFPDNITYYYTSDFPVNVGDKVFVEGTKEGVPGMVARINTYAGGNAVVKAYHVRVVDDSNNDLFGLPESI